MTHDTISLIEKLRTVTKDCHERLHEHPLTCSLGSTCLTKREYVITLCAFQKFYENIMAEVSKIDNDFCFDQIRLIKNDLQNLGYEVNPLKQCRYLTLAQNKDALWGVLYVTEGSKLGGQLISKNIKKVLNLHHDTGNSFFSSEGKFTAKDWQNFITNMSRSVKDQDHCVIAANKVFLALENWLWNVHKYSKKMIAA